MGSINKNIARYELTTVYKHPLAHADIVLVHGLNGNPVRTWTAPKTGVYWPADLLPASLKDAHANVLVYGYNADVYATGSKKDKSPSDNFVHMHAQSLITSLTQYRKSEGTDRLPLIWVAHSLGGIVTKRALLYSNDVRAHHQEDYRSIFVSTYGIIFLGTPHTGSDLAGWGRVLQYMSDVVIPRRFFETESVLIKTLKKDNETLASINNHFLDIYQRFRIHMVHENHTTDVRGAKVYVVDALSASPQLPGVTYYGIEANHSGMCKFESESAPGYRNVSSAIREWVVDSPRVIQVRWEVEEDDRRLRADLENYERVRSYSRPSASAPQQQAVEMVEGTTARSNEIILPLPERTPVVGVPPPIPMLPEPPKNEEMATKTEIEIESPSSIRTQPLLLEAPPTRVNSFPRHDAVHRRRDSIRRHGDQQPLFIHPDKFRPNSYFVGREDELRGLHEMLMDRRRRSEGTSAVLIQCLPGGGKTHLARQYVFQHRDDYPGGVYWVRAKSRQEMEYWYWRIAKNEALRGLVEQKDVEELRDPRKIVAVVRRWLSSQEGWLMVLDGVQFDIEGLHEFIPDARNTGLIYTSTERAVTGDPRFDNPQVMELGLLTAQQAQVLLLLEMDRRPPWGTDEMEKALELVQLMGRLPLMIHVAAQHLKATREPLARYLRSYRSRPKASGLPAYRAVREQLEHRGANAALNLISLLVFFDQHIPVEMVSLGLSALDKTTPIKSCDASHRKTNLNNTLRTLIAFALVERTESDDISPASSRSSKSSFDKHADYLDLLRIHSVVQAFFIETLQEERQVDFWLERTTAIWCRSYDEAHKRIQADIRVGRPDDYRRFAIHGEKLLQNLDRFEKRYPQLLSKARVEVQTRLEKIQGQIDDLSEQIQASIVNGSKEETPASVFDRSSSVSETDSATTPSNEDSQPSFFSGDGESPGPMMSPVMYDPTSPFSPTEWQVPYPSNALMPAAPDVPDDDDATVVSQLLEPSRAPMTGNAGGSQQEFEDWQEVIPHHRVIRRHESRRYHDRGGAWRDTTVSDPRVGISQELAAGSVLSRRPPSKEPSRSQKSRVTAKSDAEMELNKIKQALPATPAEPAESSEGGKVRPSYLLGRNSYAQVLAKPAPETELAISPVQFTSGLAQIISSPKSWTYATVKRLKENVLPSRPKAPTVPASPASVTVSQHGDDVVSQTAPGPIFAGRRSANSSPASRSSPFPPPTFSALQDAPAADELAHSNLAIRRWDTNVYHPGLTRLGSSDVDADPLSFSYPSVLPSQHHPGQPPPIWIRAAPRPSGYTSQPASHQSTPSAHEHSSSAPLRRPPLPPSGTATHHSSPLAISASSSPPTNAASPSPNHRLHLHPFTSHNRRPSYTETEPSPRRDAAFPDLDTSYSRWEQLHHTHTHREPAATPRESFGQSFPPVAAANHPALGRVGRGMSSSPRSHSQSPSRSPSRGGGAVGGRSHPLATTAYSSPAGSPRQGVASLSHPPSAGGGGEPMARTVSGGSGGSPGVAGIRVGGEVVEFGATPPGGGVGGKRSRSSSGGEYGNGHGLGISQSHGPV
ncbi:hypothetical protein B0T16DRAFT_132506 [Cercophora newfieldiana]|uniref:DUF676 domain-containing protein n=1 Tax=Cercophora newfieldiana TaxID=92897 RepID=A0AA39YBC6_9PEZI|nr:hypothetical protein B0T16DRAFT_132506 [Cercophora newfieldiana]